MGHLKFMQRAKLREEQRRKALADEEALKESPKTAETSGRKCVVIFEGDPRPGAGSGRMSFQPSTPAAETSKKQASQKKVPVGDHASCQKTTDSS